MIIRLTDEIIKSTLQRARESPRKRAIYCLHNPNETLQRMVNAGLSETYVQPHKHEKPDKIETFTILRGQVGILTFDNRGNIDDKLLLCENETSIIAEIPPRTWHSLVIMSHEAAVYEVIEGKYDQMTHKQFSPWSPPENSPEIENYLRSLKNQFL